MKVGFKHIRSVMLLLAGGLGILPAFFNVFAHNREQGLT